VPDPRPDPADADAGDGFVPLDDILTLEELGGDVWRGYTPPHTLRPDIFGGQVASQCLRAAAFTVDDTHAPNSVHCYFLRRGNPQLPLDLRVERIRSGRTYATRRVEAVQGAADGGERVIFTMLASFHTPEPGRVFDGPAPVGVPAPDTIAAPGNPYQLASPVDSRHVVSEDVVVRSWIRVRGELGADPILQYCALLYVSDMHAGGAAMRAIGVADGPPPQGEHGEMLANFGSLDHSVWFHRRPVMADWVFCEAHPMAVRDSRGLVRGTIHDGQGVHLATLAQEMFLKVLVDDEHLPADFWIQPPG